tara:strand:- start:6163 stop:6954 length:792 start_codon:yes stop_codon:yes gene_type:complete
MKTAEHVEFYKNLKDEPLDTTSHPLDNFAKIDQKFTTPFMESDTSLPEKMRKDLVKVLIHKETALSELKESNPEFYGMAHSKGFYATTHYNLFDSVNEFPFAKDSILGFKEIACQMIRYYIRKGWGVQQADDMQLEGRCFGNVQQPGARTYPHYHQDINGVLVHYLKMGDEDKPLEEQMNKDFEKSARHGGHTVIFQDPRPAISYPYWEKVHTISPRVGLTIVHPNYVWHETNPWLGEGIRVCIVVNFRIVSHGYNELLKPLE